MRQAVTERTVPTILIVDDTPANVEAVQGILDAEGFHTLAASDGRSAREATRAEQPDLILMDVLMPGESGFETCARLKSDPRTAAIPIIFLSALDDVQNKVTGLKIGGVDYVSKPIHGEELLARVRVHLRISESSRVLAEHHRAQLEELRDAQQSILVRPQDCPDGSFAAYYQPLEAAGGDFYDVVAIDSGLFGYFVADVSGHGPGAAFLTSAIKALLRQYATPVFSAEDTMRHLDSIMRQLLGEEQYLTACYARLNQRTGRLSVVSAGHPPMVLVRATGRVEVVQVDSEPVGVFSAAVLQRKDLRVASGDRFFLYSDGLIESSPGGGRREGMERLVEACVRHRSMPLEEATRQIVGDLRCGRRAITDDELLLAVEVRM